MSDPHLVAEPRHSLACNELMMSRLTPKRGWRRQPTKNMAFLTQHLERLFCGSSFDPFLKADSTPTSCVNSEEVAAWESPASFGTVWPRSLPICSCLCHRSLTQCGIAAFVRTADHGQEHTRWNQPVTAYVQDLCLRLWCGASASFSGTKAHSD